jgi:regulator of protease activity HflC (stomatin/prohibitin superfamily)
MELAGGVIAFVIVILAVITVLRSVRIVPQARARNVERLGRYRKTLEPGMNFIIPFIDRVKPLIDLREQVVSFMSQPVITEDNLVVLIDTVLFFQVTDPRAADYEIVDYIQAIEQITATMLRSVIGSMDLEQTLTSRDKINNMLRGVLDDASGKWGIRVTRVEIKAIEPPKSVVDAMEKQMRAEREKRAAILTAEGLRQAKILTAEGEKQSAILSAEGEKQSAILKAQGQAQAIGTVFKSIHDGNPDAKVLAYQYLQTLPQLAQGQGNTFWVIPSEVTSALKTLAGAFDSSSGGSEAAAAPLGGPDVGSAAVGLAPGADLPAVTAAPAVQPNGAPGSDQDALTAERPDAAPVGGQPALTSGMPAAPPGTDPDAVSAGRPDTGSVGDQPPATEGPPDPGVFSDQPPASLQPDGEPDGQQRAEGELYPPGLPERGDQHAPGRA